MQQNKKIKILIGFCVLAILILISIQCYLVYSTYQYKESLFKANISRTINKITNSHTAIDSIQDEMKTVLVPAVLNYFTTRDSLEKALKNNVLGQKRAQILETLLYQKEQLKNNLFQQDNFKENAKFINHLINAKLAEQGFKYKVNYLLSLSELNINDNEIWDTIYHPQKDKERVWLGEQAEIGDAFRISKNRQVSESREEHEVDSLMQKDVYFAYILGTKEYIDIPTWRQIVLGQMLFTLLGAIFSVLFVMFLFFWSLNALIRQKKIADIQTDFINNVTHELQTPLATLGIATQTLQKEEILNNKTQTLSIVQTIARQQKRLKQLVNQVLNNSVEASALVLNKKEIKINDFIKNIVADFKLKNPKVTLNLDLQTPQKTVLIDAFNMTTAINNILENMQKHNSPSVEINIDVFYKKDKLHLNIQDNGKGIAKSYQAHIFKKFYRVPTGNVHNVKGLGLGLYLTHEIIKAHQGTISVESKEGEGCLFKIAI